MATRKEFTSDVAANHHERVVVDVQEAYMGVFLTEYEKYLGFKRIRQAFLSIHKSKFVENQYLEVL